MSSRSAGLFACAVVVFLGRGGAWAQVDPFYLDLDRDAQIAAARGENAAAAKLFRVACFGMLDEPDRLAACTVRLMKTQAAVKDVEGFRASFLRLAAAQERFQALSRSGLLLEERREIALLAAARLKPEMVAQIPELAELVAAKRAEELSGREDKASNPKERRRRGKVEPLPTTGSAAPALAGPEPAVPQLSAEPPRNDAVQAEDLVASAPTGSVAASDEDLATAAEMSAKSSDQERLDTARRRVSERPDRSAVEAELDAVRAIADRSEGDVGAARLAGDLAYLLGLWPVCADYYQRAGDPGPDQPLGRFYMAVCLFETGQTEGAARLIGPSADRLKRSPFVDSYLTRILGNPEAP